MTKKVLLISNRLDFGGAEIYVISIANRLLEHNYDVFAASSGGLLVNSLDTRVKHFTIPADAKTIPEIINCSEQLKKIIKEYSIELIHTNSVYTCLIARLATLFTKTVIINTAHSWGTNKKPISARIVNWCSHKVIAVSESTGNSYVENGLNKSKLVVIHNGINTEKFQKVDEKTTQKYRQSLNISPDDFVIINIARMEEKRKAHDFLLETAKEIIIKHPHCKFLFVGDGNLRSGLEKLSGDLQLEKNVYFLGNRTDVVELLSLSNVFCLPSDWEGLPLVIAEAMACELPVVATAVNGVPEIVIHNSNGLLSSPRNIKQLYDNLCQLIESPDQTSSFSKASLERAQKYFSLNSMIEKVLKTYSSFTDKQL